MAKKRGPLKNRLARLATTPCRPGVKVAALRPAHWHANSNHPLRRFRRTGDGWSFDPVTRASFDQAVVAWGNGLDLVIVRTAED